MNNNEIKMLLKVMECRDCLLDCDTPSQVIDYAYSLYPHPQFVARESLDLTLDEYDNIFCDKVTATSVYRDKYSVGSDVDLDMLREGLENIVHSTEFTISDLETGMFVIEKNQFIHMVVGDVLLRVGNLDPFSASSHYVVQSLQSFNRDMTYHNPSWDIVSVYRPRKSEAKHYNYFIECIRGNRVGLSDDYIKVFDRNIDREKRAIDSEIGKLENQIEELRARKAEL